MTIDYQVFEKCICQTTTGIDEGVLKIVSVGSMQRKEKVHSCGLPVGLYGSLICALSLCTFDSIPLFFSAFPLSPRACVLTTAGAMQ